MADAVKSKRARAHLTTSSGGASPSASEPRLSHLRRPTGLDVRAWQTRLRRQFGRMQPFSLENIGGEPVFSEYWVSNPKSGSRYRVAIRGAQPGDNFCACPDFATNDLGTCKHIEFVLSRLDKKRAGRKAAAKLFSGPPAGVLPVAHFAKLEAFLATAHKSEHEVRCYEDALNFIAQNRDAEERRRIINAAYPRGARSAALKDLIKTDLYPYQAEGALFAARSGRCLIGDEMGLGKTIQAIAATELFARHFGAERVLIVCPTSLKHQWQREIAHFTDRQARVVRGLRVAREDQYAQTDFYKITNYDVLSKDLDLIRD